MGTQRDVSPFSPVSLQQLNTLVDSMKPLQTLLISSNLDPSLLLNYRPMSKWPFDAGRCRRSLCAAASWPQFCIWCYRSDHVGWWAQAVAGISGTALKWISSYLSGGSFSINVCIFLCLNLCLQASPEAGPERLIWRIIWSDVGAVRAGVLLFFFWAGAQSRQWVDYVL